MKKAILANWNFMRFLRLGIGIAIVVQAIIANNWTMGVIGTLFISMPLFNVGCCATGGGITPVKNDVNNTKDITYEEVV